MTSLIPPFMVSGIATGGIFNASTPSDMQNVVNLLEQSYGNLPIYIHENGMSLSVFLFVSVSINKNERLNIITMQVK